MELFQLLTHRHSVRKFEDRPVPDELVDQLILAANTAPVGSNLYRDVHLTVVRDKAVLHALGDGFRYRMKDRATIRAITKSIENHPTQQREVNPFYGAPVVIFVSHRKQDLQPGIQYCNVTSIVQTIHLAAVELGLGSVYMWGSLEAMRIYPQYDNTSLLELPPDFEPLLGIAIGYAAQERPPREPDPSKIGINYI